MGDLDENGKDWLGTSIEDICKGQGHWKFCLPPVIPSKYHNVLFEIDDVNEERPPKPHYPLQPCDWHPDYVRQPFSTSNLFPLIENGEKVLKSRWKLITKALTSPLQSIEDFERAVHSYNKGLPKFTALRHFFTEVLEEEESQYFFENILPTIVNLALDLPNILPAGLPLLKKSQSRSVSLSQYQIASLLANAFFCTFPWRKDVAVNYPGVNFSKLYNCESDSVTEKLKCIFHYFRRICEEAPTGVVTFERKFIPRSYMPRWDKLKNNLGNVKINISSVGTIEDNGLGFLQVDFANKNVGGGVLGYGCVQEEIRFVICPELIISRLFVEQLGDNEAVVVIGAERFSNYTGYADSFKWDGNHLDQTPKDQFGRRKTSICIIDAIHFNSQKDQFFPSAILREVNKAYVGFSSREKVNLAPVATGNWGCGAFRGDRKLKSLIQLMAAAAAARDLIYYSFGDKELMKDFYNMHLFLANNQIIISQLWIYLRSFSSSSASPETLYAFIQQSYFDMKNKPVTDYFKPCSAPTSPKPSTSEAEISSNLLEDEDVAMLLEDFDPDVIPLSDNECDKTPPKKSSKQQKESIENKLPQNHSSIIELLSLVDGNANQAQETQKEEEQSFLKEIDKLKYKKNTSMEVEEVGQGKSKKRITDYFTKQNKST